MNLDYFANTVASKIIDARYNNIEPEWLILDDATFKDLKNYYKKLMSNPLPKIAENNGYHFMGLLIAISSSKKTVIKVV